MDTGAVRAALSVAFSSVLGLLAMIDHELTRAVSIMVVGALVVMLQLQKPLEAVGQGWDVVKKVGVEFAGATCILSLTVGFWAFGGAGLVSLYGEVVTQRSADEESAKQAARDATWEGNQKLVELTRSRATVLPLPLTMVPKTGARELLPVGTKTSMEPLTFDFVTQRKRPNEFGFALTGRRPDGFGLSLAERFELQLKRQKKDGLKSTDPLIFDFITQRKRPNEFGGKRPDDFRLSLAERFLQLKRQKKDGLKSTDPLIFDFVTQRERPNEFSLAELTDQRLSEVGDLTERLAKLRQERSTKTGLLTSKPL
jgi:hypothetical protein